MNDGNSKFSLGLRSCLPKFPAGSIFYTKYTTIGREQDASNKATSSLARNSAVPAANLVCQEHPS